MTLNKKMAIIYDTNNFIPGENKTFDLTGLNLEEYYKLKNTIDSNKLQDNVQLFFPEIVLSELLINHKRLLKNKIKTLNSLNSRFNNFKEIEISTQDINIENFCKILKQKYLIELNILPLPKDKTKLFDDILTMALNRFPPFIKKDNNNKNDSDKGFKDSILFLSVLKYSETHNFDKYVIVSNDTGFKKGENGLKSKFNHHNNGTCELEIKSNNELTQYILDEYKLFRELMEYLNKHFYYDIEDEYYCNPHINVDFDVPMSNFEIITDYTKIYEIKENEFEVTLFIQINVDYLDEYIYVKEDLSQNERYIIKKNGENWEYELQYRQYEIF